MIMTKLDPNLPPKSRGDYRGYSPNTRAWTYEGYWAEVLGDGDADTVCREYELVGSDGLDEWLGTAEEAWLGGKPWGTELPPEWDGFHQRALAELSAAAEELAVGMDANPTERRGETRTREAALDLESAIEELDDARIMLQKRVNRPIVAHLARAISDIGLALEDSGYRELGAAAGNAAYPVDLIGEAGAAHLTIPRMLRQRDAILMRLSAAEEVLRAAQALISGGDTRVLIQLGNALDDIAFVLNELNLDATAVSRLSYQLTLAGSGRSMTPNAAELDSDAAEELVLYLTNDSRLWGPQSQGEAIERRYAKFWKKGSFTHERAVDGYMHVLKSAAQQYVKDNGSPGDRWYEMFNVPTRRKAAEDLIDDFIAEAELGNFRG